MITMRKSTHGFPSLSYDKYGAPLGGPSGHRSSAINIVKFKIGCLFEFGKSATRDGDVTIVGKHFCAGYILYILKRADVPVYFPGELLRLIYLHWITLH